MVNGKLDKVFEDFMPYADRFDTVGVGVVGVEKIRGTNELRFSLFCFPEPKLGELVECRLKFKHVTKRIEHETLEIAAG